MLRPSTLRVVNYHLTPACHAAVYDREFAALSARYDPVTEDALVDYLATGHWPMGRDGVLPVFYNGYRNNYDVARPLLEKHGLVGWFLAVTAYSSCPAAAQTAFAASRTLTTIAVEYPDGRSALSWDELRMLDGRHVVGSHTRNHTRVGMDDPAVVEAEIVGAQDDFMRELGHPVRALAWLYGGRYGENPVADGAVNRAGYQLLFSNFAVQRLR